MGAVSFHTYNMENCNVTAQPVYYELKSNTNLSLIAQLDSCNTSEWFSNLNLPLWINQKSRMVKK
jgi:hypothetical protein